MYTRLLRPPINRSFFLLGPWDTAEEIDGAALETLVWQEIRALNDYFDKEYQISFWRTRDKIEVDLVLYGPNGFFALEIKRNFRVRPADLTGLRAFLEDYPEAQGILLYTGDRSYHESGIDIIALKDWFGISGEAMKRLFSTDEETGHDKVRT